MVLSKHVKSKYVFQSQQIKKNYVYVYIDTISLFYVQLVEINNKHVRQKLLTFIFYNYSFYSKYMKYYDMKLL